MTNSPDQCTQSAIRQIFITNNCKARLKGGHIDLETNPLNPPLNGAVEFRWEEHKSKDSTCVVQYNIYVADNGREAKFIYTLEIDGKEYISLSDFPLPIWDEIQPEL
jgi:hypothetical protein